MEDDDRHLTHTTISIGVEQKEWLQESNVNISQVVRAVVDEARERDEINEASLLEGIIAERELLKSRCQQYDLLLKEAEGFKARSLKDLDAERGGDTGD